MKRIILAMSTVAVLTINSSALAACKTTYDYTSGNNYQTCENTYNQSTTIKGNNYNTGSSWETTYKKDNTYTGRDSNNNQYRGNNKTGEYYNYGTGKYCTGTGYSRICTGG